MEGLMAKITVSSEITAISESGAPIGDPEITGEQALGELTVDGERVTVKYRTHDESGAQILSTLSISGATVTLDRQAGVCTHMVFEQGVTHTAIYSVGAYSFDVTVTARRVRGTLGAEGGRIDLYYDMCFGSDQRSVRMRIDVLTKNKARSGL